MHLSKLLAPSLLVFMLSSSLAYATNTFGADNEYDEAVAKGVTPKTISIDQLNVIIAAQDACIAGISNTRNTTKSRKTLERKASEQPQILKGKAPILIKRK